MITYFPKQTLIGRDITFHEPYQPLFHYYAELEAYKNRHPSTHSEEYQQECNEHIDILLNYLSKTCGVGELVEAELERHRRDPPVCTFEYLWLLFKPGEICYGGLADLQQISAYVTFGVSGGIIRGVPERYVISNWNISFDGWEVGQEMFENVIQPFDGEKEIRSFDFYFPAKYHQETPENLAKYGGVCLRDRLIAKGKRWWDVCRRLCQGQRNDNAIHIEFDGIAVSPPYKKV